MRAKIESRRLGARLEATSHAEQHAPLKTQVRRIEQQLRDRIRPTPDAQRLVWIPWDVRI